ncbi:MAG TPA: histidinol-phosphate transaminase [Thermoanaerobaculia bacterium]|jgi:histidinol-phosphate aminotransferase
MTRSTIAAMAAYTLELREAEVKLNQNESPFDFPEELKRAVFARIEERGWNLYPDFETQALRDALARAYGLTSDNILTGNGSNELLAATIGAVVAPGTPVIFPRPAFTLYEKLVTVANGLPIPIDFEPDSGLLPLERMLAAATRGSVVIVCSPNNPTGGVLEEGGLEALLATGATILFDRAYGDFAGDTLPPLDDRLITFSTFSKSYSLAGLRLGWLASTARTCTEIRKVKLPYSLNVFSEAAALVALENPWVRERNVAQLVTERDRVVRAMRDLGRLTVFPTRANFIAFRPQRKALELFEELIARGILIRNVSAYPQMQNCLRVSIGTPEQNDRFLAALQELG